jgi:LAO/AO transport system kinase
VNAPSIVDRSAPEGVQAWAAQVRDGDVRALARAITAIENQQPQAEALLEQLFPSTGKAFLIGVTGAPGTGKSTLVDRLAGAYRSMDRSVGIIAVDPTSPYTGGAVLGDRIRMQNHSGDAGVFIRSMATRGFLGGLARATADVALLLDAAGKQVVILETVGVGQDEVDIVRLADCTLVLMVPGLGDDVQSMKAGLMEVADIFVLNKAERDGADRLQQQIEAMLELAPGRRGWTTPVVRTTATEGAGVAQLIDTIEQFRMREELAADRRSRMVGHWKQRLRTLLGEHLIDRTVAKAGGEGALEALAGDVAERRVNPYTAVREIAARAGI